MRSLLIVTCATIVAQSVFAHPGGVDAAGGHVDKATGVYHFHRVGGPDGPTVEQAMKPKAAENGTTAFSDARRLKAARENAAASLLKSAQQSSRRATALRAVARLFADTDAGKRAGRIADRLDPDGEQPATKEEQSERDAQERIDIARQLMQLKQHDLAIEILKATVESHPDTKAAENASSILQSAALTEEFELPDGGFFEKRMQDLESEESAVQE